MALLINSPGGSPVQSALIADRIRALAEQKRRPVLAFVEDVAASGGYWLACAADEILADAASIVGSIGVISAGFGFQDAIARLGIERRVHTAGERKALLDPFRPEQPDDLELLREHPRRRSTAGSSPGCASAAASGWSGRDGELFDGRVWTGAAAVQQGLIDGLGEARATSAPASARRRGCCRSTRARAGCCAGCVSARRLHICSTTRSAVLEARAHWQRFGL